MKTRFGTHSVKSAACGPHHPAGAFTLIELVISAALMALILGSAYACFSASISSQRIVEGRVDALQNARVAMAMITADLRSACVLSKEFEFLGMHRMLGAIEADNLDFATHNYTPKRARESDFCETSYFVQQQGTNGLVSLWRRRDPTPDPEPLSGGTREEIARGLVGVSFEYYDGFDWFEEWGDPQGHKKGRASALEPSNLSGLPEAVRITLLFDPSFGSQKPAGAEKPEPPLAFQTVVRLNLTDAAMRRTSSSSSSNVTDSATSPGNNPNPTGGTQ